MCFLWQKGLWEKPLYFYIQMDKKMKFNFKDLILETISVVTNKRLTYRTVGTRKMWKYCRLHSFYKKRP